MRITVKMKPELFSPRNTRESPEKAPRGFGIIEQKELIGALPSSKPVLSPDTELEALPSPGALHQASVHLTHHGPHRIHKPYP
ncbi:E3 Isg15--Protein Ligase Herc5 [Manis pentadactyla]|nr:E3 Isg15--Protein Ligase Herc5 [Manis pentadactyla]